MQQINYLCHVQMKMKVARESTLAKDVLMLYNILPNYFQAKQELDLKIKTFERRAGEKDSSTYPGYTYVAPVNTEIFFSFFPRLEKDHKQRQRV